MIEKRDPCDFEVLLSCMHQSDFEIAYKSRIDSDLLIINQCDKEDYQEQVVNGYLWRMISTTERGLSRSRNMALDNARGSICLFADNDETFSENYSQMIIDAFQNSPDAAVIAFNVRRINVPMKKSYYRIQECKESRRSFGAPMTAVRMDTVRKAAIRFNTEFGSGSEWGGGEDSLFQKSIRGCGLKIYEHPGEIATIDYSNESCWFHGYTEEYFYQQGAFAEYCKTPRIKRELYAFYSSFIKLRKEKTLSPLQKIIWRHRGEQGWRKNVTYSQYVDNGYSYRSK